MCGCWASSVRADGDCSEGWGDGFGRVNGCSDGGGKGGEGGGGGLLSSCQRLVPEALESGR